MNQEKVRDDILIYLRDNKWGKTIDNILVGTSSYHKEIRETIKFLEYKGYIEPPKDQAPEQAKLSKPYKGGLLGVASIQPSKPTTYQLTEKGKEFLSNGGFKKENTLIKLATTERLALFFFALLSFILAIPYCNSPDNKILETGQMKESETDTTQTNSADDSFQIVIDTPH